MTRGTFVVVRIRDQAGEISSDQRDSEPGLITHMSEGQGDSAQPGAPVGEVSRTWSTENRLESDRVELR
jgi:hypothetical protein